MRKFAAAIMIALILVVSGLSGCSLLEPSASSKTTTTADNITTTTTTKNVETTTTIDGTTKLLPPTGLYVDDQAVLRWTSVDNASYYVINISGDEYQRSTIACDLKKILSQDGTYIIKIKALSNKTTLTESEWSEAIIYNFNDGLKTKGSETSGLFGQFDDLYTEEAYIGYGYDVIGSSYVNSNEVKINFPIFDKDKLMDKRLLMIKERRSNDSYISGNSMESYMSSFTAKLSTKIKVKKAFSAGVKASFTTTSDSTQSALFYEYSHSTTLYQLILQCDFNDYKELLTDSFKRDLMTLDIGTLFSRYGTHLITSVEMGGRFDLNYTMLSESNIDTTKISGELDTTFKAWAVDVTVNVSAAASETAKSNNCTISSTSSVFGGDNTQMNNENAILKNYSKWIDSIEERPSLIGIRDVNSLVGIWELLGDSEEEQRRKQEIYDAFVTYGEESYEELLESYNIKTPTYPESVTATLEDSSHNPVNLNEVVAGSTLFLDIDVEPAIAVVTKSITCDKPDYFTWNSEDSSIVISPNTPNGEKLVIRVDVGHNVYQVITIYVYRFYKVEFNSNGGSKIDTINNIAQGSKIDPPSDPLKDGYRFNGWYYYEDPVSMNGYKEFLFNETPITRDYVLYAEWLEFKPQITFVNSVSEISESIAPIKIKYNSKVPEPETQPEASGYTFIGYYKDANLTQEFDFDTLIIDDTRIYLRWEKNPIVSFVSNTVDPVESLTDIEVRYGGTVARPANPTVYGYVFQNFYSNEERTIDFNFNSVITSNTTIYAGFAKDKFTVTFMVDGSVYSTANVDYLDTVSTPDVPIKQNYLFSGWFDNNNSPYDFTTKVTANITLIAHFSATAITIHLDPTDGQIDENLKNVYIDAGSSIDYLDNIKPVKTGYTFDGWYKEIGYVNKVYNTTVFTDSTTIYAKWKINSYKIEFYANGGTGSMDSVNAVFNTNVTIPTCTFNRTGYKCIGWSQDQNSTNANYAFDYTFKYTFTEDMKLYAVWQKISYTIVFNGNAKYGHTPSGTMSSISAVYGDSYTIPQNTFTLEECTFLGWSLNSDATNATYTDGATVSNLTTTDGATVTLFAVWSRVGYRVEFQYPNGTRIGDVQYVAGGSTASAPSPISNSTFTFSGWDKSLTITGDTIIKATYTRKKITFSVSSTYNFESTYGFSIDTLKMVGYSKIDVTLSYLMFYEGGDKNMTARLYYISNSVSTLSITQSSSISSRKTNMQDMMNQTIYEYTVNDPTSTYSLSILGNGNLRVEFTTNYGESSILVEIY